jgi:polysaccharide export outer membrane protein
MKIKTPLLTAIFLVMILLSSTILPQNLKPGDGIKITFFNIEDSVEGNYIIQENDELHLPYLGIIKTVDKDFSKIAFEVVNGYKELYNTPEIDVRPLYRINVLGEVKNPGIYYLSGFETLTDVISLAGGENSDSDTDEITVIRNDEVIELDIEAFLDGDNNLNDIGIQSGDKIFVPRTWWVGARDASIIVSGVAVLAAIVSLFTK